MAARARRKTAPIRRGSPAHRPQWVAALRNLGYAGAIILHLHNDHVGHWPTADLDELAGKLDQLGVCSDYLRSKFAAKSPALMPKLESCTTGPI